METYEIINYLIKNREYHSYLEIGLDNPNANFNNIECDVKESVDPYFETELTEDIRKALTYRMPSDQMFETIAEDKTYDIVFIDGGHTEEQCCRDIVNSMKHLNQGGCILVHDCIPYNELAQRTVRESELWNGDVWKSVYKLNNRNVEFKTVAITFGMAIIEYASEPNFEGYCGISNLDYSRDFSLEKLNVIVPEDFLALYKKIDVPSMGVDFNLVAHFYIKKEWELELPQIYKLHFACIEKYKNIFNNSIFVLSVDEGCSEELLNFYKRKIIEIGIRGNISIKIKKNTAYREASTFKEEIVDKLSELNGITYFIHGKGITNFGRTDINPDSVNEWVLSSYYQLFSKPDYVVKSLISENTGICYGAFLFNNDFCLTNHDWYFSGSFQAINTKKLLNYINNHGIKIPELCDRAYAEAFLGDCLEFNPFFVRSFNGKYGTTTPLIMYKEAEVPSKYIIGDEMIKYSNFKQEILSAVNGN